MMTPARARSLPVYQEPRICGGGHEDDAVGCATREQSGSPIEVAGQNSILLLVLVAPMPY